MNVIIGFLLAWRGIPAAAAAALQAAKQASDIAVKAAEVATVAAAPTPGGPAAYAAEQTLKAANLAALSSTIAGYGRHGGYPFMCDAVAASAARPRCGH